MEGTPLRFVALFGGIIALFIVIGGLVGEYLFGSWIAGLVIALGLSLVLNLVSYFFCDRFVLWSSHAKIVGPDRRTAPHTDRQ